jgi:hypothetical protein
VQSEKHDTANEQACAHDDTGATSALRAPRHLVALGVADRADGGRRPEAEVVRVVDPRRLARAAL